MYKIESITKDGVPRTDGRYPLRIGSIVEIVSLDIGRPFVYQYIKDANGNDKEGYLTTSTIIKLESDFGLNTIVVTTRNSVYTLTKFADE